MSEPVLYDDGFGGQATIEELAANAARESWNPDVHLAWALARIQQLETQVFHLEGALEGCQDR